MADGSAAVFRALADETRRVILDELVDQDGLSLFDVCARLTMRHGIGSSRQAVSQHLAVLEEAGLVTTRREGRTKRHHLHTEPLRAITDRWPQPPNPTRPRRPTMPRITTASVFVDDQAKALAFYTDVLGFLPKTDIPVGEFRWLTVVSDTDPDGTELLLEPDDHPAAKAFKAAIAADGIPATSFGVDDIEAAYASLVAKGATVTQPPTDMGPVTTLVVDDTCGNLIQLASPPRG